MTKKVYTIKGFEDRGKTFTRSTDRNYTHAVIIRRDDLEDSPVHVAGYCSRLDLAEKLKNTVERYYARVELYYPTVKFEICETVRLK